MLIKVVHTIEGAHVTAEFSFGDKASGANSFLMQKRGELAMSSEEWEALQSVLSRGAKRPVTLVIEQG